MSTRAPGPTPVERVRNEHPPDGDWRADGLARSRHPRLADAIEARHDDHDLERAETACAALCRQALADFAPGLMLLPREERRRTQVLTAFALTLFDLAAKPGLDGDRLSEINRWEFQLEEALSGRPPGQPVFVALAAEEQRSAWSRSAIDALVGEARRQAAVGLEGPRSGPRDDLVAGAYLELAIGSPPTDAWRQAGADLLVLAREDGGKSSGRAPVMPPDALPRGWRRAGRFVVLASRHLAGLRAADKPVRLGLARRLLLLIRAVAG